MKYILITNEPDLAEKAEQFGVSRIFIDLEQLGKFERQGHLDTFISSHSMADVAKVRARLSKAELLVRLNPLNENTKQEIDEAIEGGADILMLPMFHHASELRSFSEMVGRRAGVMPLLETYSATQEIDEIVTIPGVTEIYIGLNDLHLDMKLKFMFEPLANGLVDKLADVAKAAGLPFGFGGIARVGEGIIPGELVLGEHLRLGSSAILSRTFNRKDESCSKEDVVETLREELEKLQAAKKELIQRDAEKQQEDCLRLKNIVTDFVAQRS
jgi:hypothetical protein